MAAVTIRLPSLLSSLLNIPRSISASGDTLEQVLHNLRRDRSQLAPHLFDESGSFREHVLCFVNDTNTRDIEKWKQTLEDGDVITILQAVSGG